MPSPPPPPSAAPQLSVLTFNLLAPCYKRLHKPGVSPPHRESDYPALWKARLAALLDLLLSIAPRPDVIALQEVWFHPPFLAQLDAALSPHYHIFYARRALPKQDGVATLVRRDSPRLANPALLARVPLAMSDRVALAVTADLLVPHPANSPRSSAASIDSLPTSPSAGLDLSSLNDPAPRLLILNTHLTFPHLPHDAALRLAQADSVARYAASAADPRAPTLVLGDFNGDDVCRPARRMRRDHFVNCLPSLHGPHERPVTHLNHCGQTVFVDHVFVRDPTPRVATAVATALECSSPTTPSAATAAATAAVATATATSTSAVCDEPRVVRFADQFDDEDEDDDRYDDYDDDFDAQRDASAPPPPRMSLRKRKHRRSVSALRVEDAPFDSDGSPPPSPVGTRGARAPLGAVESESESEDARKDEWVSMLRPVSSTVYPEGVCTRSWPAGYDVSDHRAVGVVFRIGPCA